MKPATILLASSLAACSALDPSVGPLYVESSILGDSGLEQDAGQDADDIDAGGISFARDIRPLINRPGKGDPTGRGCKGCHYRNEANHVGIDLSGFDMTTLGSLRLGGGSSAGRILVPGKPSESVLVQVLNGQYPYSARMPKGGSQYWTTEDVQRVADWITQGARGRSSD